MKDKEKQIWQDVANVMCECEDKENFTQRYNTKCRGCNLLGVIRHIVFFLNNSDYRKINKDSVVLSKAKYEMLTACSSYEGIMGKLKDEYIRGSKETAEKLIHLLADYKEYDYESCSYKDWCVPHTIIKHIAQSVGIDIRTLNDKPTKKPLKFNGVTIKE